MIGPRYSPLYPKVSVSLPFMNSVFPLCTSKSNSALPSSEFLFSKRGGMGNLFPFSFWLLLINGSSVETSFLLTSSSAPIIKYPVYSINDTRDKVINPSQLKQTKILSSKLLRIQTYHASLLITPHFLLTTNHTHN